MRSGIDASMAGVDLPASYPLVEMMLRRGHRPNRLSTASSRTDRAHVSKTMWVVLTRRQAIATVAGVGAAVAAGVTTASWSSRHRLPVPGSMRQSLARLRPSPSAIRVRVQTAQPIRWISPLIYGVAAAGPEELASTGACFNRWGGNPNTRYNWVLGNAWNTARDWQFNNYGWTDGRPVEMRASSAADDFINHNRSSGIDSLITVPAIGWVARDGLVDSRSTDVPARGGPAKEPLGGSIEGYDPAGNRARTSVRSVARKSGPFVDQPDPRSHTVFQDEWVAHLVRRFGTADDRGVKYYAIDNEPDLWSETHTDVAPAEQGYQQMLAPFLEYAGALKDVDPAARIAGPAVSGWTPLFFSPLDRGDDNYHSHAERDRNGGTAFLPWWLRQVRNQDERDGRRSLDVLDVHWYPQGSGVFDGATDTDTNALRLRSTRSLWDASYTDESWIRDTVNLIPRLRAWIDEAYPGTGVGIGEWNWGADTTINGALAIADVLGIFGREGVEYAAYWTSPKPGTPGAAAFRLYTNYDGSGQQFGDLALGVSSDATPDDATVYASQDSASREVTIVAINKGDSEVQGTFEFDTGMSSAAHCYVLGPDSSASIVDKGPIAVNGAQFSLSLPGSSVSLVRIGLASDT
ncbi:MAG: hypothetical protein JO023_02995 [Chloroflexi bacterium]|nr:hypothetical protein [Chloroflexota bacterium]